VFLPVREFSQLSLQYVSQAEAEGLWPLSQRIELGSCLNARSQFYSQRQTWADLCSILHILLGTITDYLLSFLVWRRQNTVAAIVSPLLGMATGIAVWIGSAHGLYGEITIASTGQTLPCVYGTVASAFSPIVYSVILSIFKPQDFDWADFRKEKLAFEVIDAGHVVNPEQLESNDSQSQVELKRWGKIAAYWSIATFLGHWVLWPLPMYASKYVFGKKVSGSSHIKRRIRLTEYSSIQHGSLLPLYGCGVRSLLFGCSHL
jgi:hypothetical protein